MRISRFVYQAVNDAALCIEAMSYRVEESAILMFIPTPNSKGDQIRKLYQSRGARIDKKRHFSNVSQLAPSRACNAELLCKCLKGLFIMGMIHNNQSLLTVGIDAAAFPEKAREIKIEAIADLLESVFNRISVSDRLLFDCHGKGTNSARCSCQYIEGLLYQFNAIISSYGSPRFLAACVHRAAVQLDLLGRSQTKRSHQFIDLSNKMKNLALENGNAAQDKVSLVRSPY